MRPQEKKSIAVSGLLSALFGPLGWVYAAPLKSAAVGGGLWLLCGMILPMTLLVQVATFIVPISAIAGILYAVGYNLTGARTPLWGDESAVPQLRAPRAAALTSTSRNR